MKIIVRKFNPGSDSGLIYSSMPKGIYHAAHNPIIASKADFFTHVYLYIKEMLPHATVLIACTKGENDVSLDPSVILGYAIMVKDCLEWVYVKEMFRKQGIATLLTKNRGLTRVNKMNLTRIGYHIMDSHRPLFKEEKEEPTNESPAIAY